MDKEQRLAEIIKQYQQASTTDANIDIADLSVKLLETHSVKNLISPSQKIWAYLVSLFLPPLGFVFAVKYYFFEEKDDAKQTAIICAVLSAAAILIASILFRVILSGSGITPEQLQDVDLQELEYLTQ